MASEVGARPPLQAARPKPAPIARLLLLLALAAALPYFLLTGWLAYNLVATRVDQATEDVERAAEVTANSIDRLVTRLRVLLRGLSERELVAALDPARCDPALGGVQRLNTEYTNVITLDATGRRICNAIPPGPGVPTHVDPALFLELAVVSRSFVLSPPTLGPVTGKWVVYAAQPIVKDGRVEGVVAVGIDLQALTKALDPRTLPLAGVAAVVDRLGRIVTRTPDAGHWIGRDASAAPAVAAALGNLPARTRARGADGVDRFWAYHPIPGTDWIAFAGVAADAVLGGPRRLMAGMVLAGALMALGVMWLSLRIARRITAPIHELGTAAAALGRDEFRPAEVAAPAEAAALARVINRTHEEWTAMERSLRDERARLEGLVASAMDGVVSVDSAHRIVLFNAAAERMFGRDSGEALGEPLAILVPERFRATHEAQVRRFEETGVTSRQMGTLGRLWGVRKNGEQFPIEASISQVMVHGERYLTAIVRDISARERAEAEVHSLNARLEQRVAERTAELEAANRELASFDYSISHDLRAPLGRIEGFAAALEEDYAARLDERGRMYLARIRATAGHMEELVRDMLALSTVSRTDIVRTEVDVTALALSALEGLQRVSPGRRVHTRVQPGMHARADAGLMRIVLDNLIGNAWKFTANREEAHIEVGAEQIPGRGSAFYVRDDGAGFDPALAGRLFEPFRRLHTHAQFEGTGVGLATVRRIVHRHGGHIWAEGEVERGATFHFTVAPPSAS